ncbi:hypothetical protein AAur_3874 [Paenarthrobacter aurescens TC1]|uniref:Uncharacterized protein n=1 Tax=Paenarthrobacter aurescens (strain TC1) TaxID=290340 RepID=A1RBD9_PAEAT|nr:hypothetical protein AAur_3874 [Paenarthrobacter aurescens TC1]
MGTAKAGNLPALMNQLRGSRPSGNYTLETTE